VRKRLGEFLKSQVFIMTLSLCFLPYYEISHITKLALMMACVSDQNRPELFSCIKSVSMVQIA